MRISNVLYSGCLFLSQKSVLHHVKSIAACRAECPVADAESDCTSCFPHEYALELQQAAEVLKGYYTSVLCLTESFDFLFSFMF